MLTSTDRVVLAGSLVVVAVLWLLLNQQVEGSVLLVVAPGMGLTVADLPSIAVVLLAAALVWPLRRP